MASLMRPAEAPPGIGKPVWQSHGSSLGSSIAPAKYSRQVGSKAGQSGQSGQSGQTKFRLGKDIPKAQLALRHSRYGDIAATDRGRFHLDEYLPVTRLSHGNSLHRDTAATWEEGSGHLVGIVVHRDSS